MWPRTVNGVGILRGIEANIKNLQGDIDCTGPMLTATDVIMPVSMSRCLRRRIKRQY